VRQPNPGYNAAVAEPRDEFPNNFVGDHVPSERGWVVVPPTCCPDATPTPTTVGRSVRCGAHATTDTCSGAAGAAQSFTPLSLALIAGFVTVAYTKRIR
jgi:hypothetical protein